MMKDTWSSIKPSQTSQTLRWQTLYYVSSTLNQIKWRNMYTTTICKCVIGVGELEIEYRALLISHIEGDQICTISSNP